MMEFLSLMMDHTRMEFSSLIMDRARTKELVELTLHDGVLIFDDGSF